MDNFIPVIDEAELRISTQQMFNQGGAANVLHCLQEMQWCQAVVMQKLYELLEPDAKS